VASSARYFATAARGVEEVLAAELNELGLTSAVAQRGGVAFGATLEEAYLACLWSRVASRILMPLTTFTTTDAATLYDGVSAVDWTEHIGPETTLAVSVAGSNSPAGPSHFVALKTKDAIVDRIRAAEGSRPDVDRRDPDVRINVHVSGSTTTVGLDFAGRGLHRRGRGDAALPAPLKENLAAAVLRIAGWSAEAGDAPLLDPMCGSGTILIEAAAIARDVAPGLTRPRAAGEGWRSHDRELWARLVAEAHDRGHRGRGRTLRIAGADASPAAVQAARQFVARAGLADIIRVERTELKDSRPPWDSPGRVVTNPPYGERLGEAGELGPLYELLGDVLKRHFPGWTAWILCGNRVLEKRIGLRPASKTALDNGPIPCRLLEIPVASTPVVSGRGPGWRASSNEARGFGRKLRDNARRARRWAEREGITCHRLYDADVPEYNLAVDWYDGQVRVEEYARPRRIDAAVAELRLRDALRVVAETLEVDPTDVVLRVRYRLGPGEQHGRRSDHGQFRVVREGDLRFRVNLTDYLDTGLFLDDRLVRRWIRTQADGKDVLNLFAYTCTASVAAAAGGARSTTSVDLSNTYLDWGRKNFELSHLAGGTQRFVRADAVRFVNTDSRSYGLIFVAPPSRSRSKGMAGDFDVQRDHPRLITAAATRLTRGGTLLFTTNRRDFTLSTPALDGLTVEDVTTSMTPPDFVRRPRLKAWIVRPI